MRNEKQQMHLLQSKTCRDNASEQRDFLRSRSEHWEVTPIVTYRTPSQCVGSSCTQTCPRALFELPDSVKSHGSRPLVWHSRKADTI